VRSVAPGTVGVRNVKWLSEVAVSPQEAVGDWQRGLNYKILPPSKKSAQGVDLSKLPAMQDASVFSGITRCVKDGKTELILCTDNDIIKLHQAILQSSKLIAFMILFFLAVYPLMLLVAAVTAAPLPAMIPMRRPRRFLLMTAP